MQRLPHPSIQYAIPAGEEAADLADPVFSEDTVPVVLYFSYIYFWADWFARFHQVSHLGWLLIDLWDFGLVVD